MDEPRSASFLREVLELAGEIFFRRVEAELWKFGEAMHDWFYGLLAHPNPHWRESLAEVLAQQEAEGRILLPESRQALIDHLEQWEATVDWSVVRAESISRTVAGDHDPTRGELMNVNPDESIGGAIASALDERAAARDQNRVEHAQPAPSMCRVRRTLVTGLSTSRSQARFGVRDLIPRSKRTSALRLIYLSTTS
jgi:hypothetical protein